MLFWIAVITAIVYCLGAIASAKYGKMRPENAYGSSMFVVSVIGVMFAFILPFMVVSPEPVETYKIDDAQVHKMDDLGNGWEYYVISDGEKISIHGDTDPEFSIGSDNTATLLCEKALGWVAPYTIDGWCYWEVVAENS